MANNVEGNVNIKITCDVKDVNSQINNIKDKFTSIGNTIEDYLNNPFKITSKSLDELNDKIRGFEGNVEALKLEPSINIESFKYYDNLVSDLSTKFAQINSIFESGELGTTRDRLNDIISRYIELKNISEEYSKRPFNVSDEQLNTFYSSVGNLVERVNALKGSVTTETLKNYSGLLTELNPKLEELGNKLGNTHKKISVSNESVNLSLESTKNALIDILNVYSKISTLGNTIEEYLADPSKVAAEQINELNETINDVKNNINSLSFSDTISNDTYNELSEYINNITQSFYQLQQTNMGEVAQSSSVNIQQLEDVLRNIVTTGRVSVSTFENLAYALGATAPEIIAIVAAIKIATETVKFLDRQIDESLETIESFSKAVYKVGNTIVDKLGDGISETFKSLGDDISSGMQMSIEAIEQLSSIISEAIDQLKEFADVGLEIEDAYYQMSALIGGDATNSLSNFANKLSEIQGISSSELMLNLNDITAATAAMGLSGDSLVDASEALTLTGQNLSIFAGSFEKASEDLGSAISKGFIGRSSSLYKIFTKNELTEFKSLNNELERYNYIMERSGRITNLYNQYLETNSGKIAILNQQYQQLLNNVGIIAENIYAMIAPVLTKILQLANTVIESLMKVFNIKVDSVSLPSVADSISDALENVGDSAESASKNVASFDDVIQISDTTDASSGLNDINYDDINSVLDSIVDNEDKALSKWDEFLNKVKEYINNNDWRGLGEYLNKELADALNSIPWDSLKKKAKAAGSAFGDFVKGFLKNSKTFNTIGKTLAEAFNVINEGIEGFLDKMLAVDAGDTLNGFEMLGTDLSQLLRGFVTSFDWEMLGSNIGKSFVGLKDILKSFVLDMFTIDSTTQQTGWQELGSSIAKMINSAFDSISKNDIIEAADSVIDLIDGLLQTIFTLFDTLDSDEILGKIGSFFTELISKLAEKSPQWFRDIGTSIASGINSLFSSLTSEDWNKLGEDFILIISGILNGIKSAFSTLDFTNIYKSLTSLFSGLVSKLAEEAPIWGSEIAIILNDIFTSMSDEDIEQNAENIITIIDSIFTFASNLLSTLDTDTFREKLKLFITDLVSKFSENADEWGETAGDIINTVLDSIIDALDTADSAGLTDAITRFIDNMDLSSIVAKIMLIKFRIGMAELKINIETFLSTWGSEILAYIYGSILSGGNPFVGLGSVIVSFLNEAGVFDDIKEWSNEKLENLGESFSAWLTKTIVTLSIKWQSIKEIFSPSTWSKLGSDALNALFSSIKNVIADIKNWFNTNIAGDLINFSLSDWLKTSYANKSFRLTIPKLATGGIVTQSTLANIGENGAEAVVPLENNTQWMDKLANKIASKIDSQQTTQSGNITIDMSSCTKDVYTRAEMLAMGQHYAQALKAYGMNVSFVG